MVQKVYSSDKGYRKKRKRILVKPRVASSSVNIKTQKSDV